MRRLIRRTLHRLGWWYSPSEDLLDFGRAFADAWATDLETIREGWWPNPGCVASLHVVEDDGEVWRWPDDEAVALPVDRAMAIGSVLADLGLQVMLVEVGEWCCICGGHHVFAQWDECEKPDKPALIGMLGTPGITELTADEQ